MIFQLCKSREYSVWILLYMTYYIFSFVLSLSCTWSSRSLKSISHCPITKSEKEYAEKNKNCEALAQKQNCTDPSNFKYHCVLNYEDNTLVEVCAPVVTIKSGYCAAFKKAIGKLVPHWKRKCDIASLACPNSYKSSEFYLYISCYGVYHNLSTDEKNYLLISVLIACLSTSLCTSAACIFAFRYNKEIRRYLKHSGFLTSGWLSKLWRSRESSEDERNDETSTELLEGNPLSFSLRS
ncbi:uncharacterized protein LOC133204298 [Saccostrea echinata]|uniref:uncharacterized protein LOC133204298 n=1 Tax=Saccostrea echinata TaxID=191078 RepID=UPI002A828D1E|nr:uncharacterized protein LOC133204298 [Saccostrea echinata]